jgi:regulator of sirC expression with transglutaminase-like and TPR domain
MQKKQQLRAELEDARVVRDRARAAAGMAAKRGAANAAEKVEQYKAAQDAVAKIQAQLEALK